MAVIMGYVGDNIVWLWCFWHIYVLEGEMERCNSTKYILYTNWFVYIVMCMPNYNN